MPGGGTASASPAARRPSVPASLRPCVPAFWRGMPEHVAMATVRWGIAGTGEIAGSVAPDFAHVLDAELTAVGSRSQERADAFAREHQIPRAHGSYRSLLADPQ